MYSRKAYNEALDSLIGHLSLLELGGAEYVELGPVASLEILFESASECSLCPLKDERESIAGINWGRGGVRAELAIVSASQITKGEINDESPRLLLEKMINAMGLSLDDVYITSAVKCVIPEPQSCSKSTMEEAISSCKDLLLRELASVSPKVVVTLGAFAATALVDTPLPFDSIRGRFQNPGSKKETAEYQIMPTHPLELLAGNKDKKKESWIDLKKVMARLNLNPAK